MTKVLKASCSPASIDRLIDQLEIWERHTLLPAVDSTLMDVVDECSKLIYQNIHVGEPQIQPSWDFHDPGRLRESVHWIQTEEHAFEIIVDATDNKGKHYAAVERERGGEGSTHDFVYQSFGEDLDEGIGSSFAIRFKEKLGEQS